MKRVLIVVFVFLYLLSSNLFAQKRSEIGFLGGLNLANVSGDVDDSEIRFGFTLGGFLKLNLNKQIALRPEIHFSSKGFKTEEKESEIGDNYRISYNRETSVSFNYLELPILGVFNINKNISIYGGPYLDLFLSGEAESEGESSYEYEFQGTTMTDSEDFDSSEDIESEDMNTPGFGLIIGAEYKLNKIIIGARYSLGLSNIPDDDNVEFKHSVIQLVFGLSLR